MPRNLDPAFCHCPVPVEFLSVSDPTMILVVELLESSISAYWYSEVSITLIRQETISLAIRNHSFRPPIEGRLIFRDISSVGIRTERVNLLHRPCTEFSLISEIESACRSAKIAEAFSSQQQMQSSYSGSDPICYPLSSLVQDTLRYCLEYIFISDPMSE